jgi:uncharacterized membrane protein YfcA
MSTLTGMGGGIMMLVTSTLVLPISAVVPLNATFILGSQLSRIMHFYPWINWKVTKPFVIGAVIGAAIGTQTHALLSEFVISLGMGVVLLLLLWLPPLKVKLDLPRPYIWLGVAHTWLSSVIGMGGLMQGAILRSNFDRHTIIATIAASLLCMSMLKILGFVMLAGFDYRPFTWAIVIATVFGFIGTWTGKYFLQFISEDRFKVLLRIVLNLLALRLFYVAWTLFAQG